MYSSGLAPFFDERLFSTYTLGVWKPEPALYRLAGEAMGFAPSECVVIDDAAGCHGSSRSRHAFGASQSLSR
ncbi:HAD-IA family hydrolase [Litchfieldella xinjiangensis]|uniref:HAD-IA family hydrolase n=1 Tax=Litchfieldella xinjiangensis TaxID=1166948 RepID=UPI002F351374